MENIKRKGLLVPLSFRPSFHVIELENGKTNFNEIFSEGYTITGMRIA
jgi:hypothetical protein